MENRQILLCNGMETHFWAFWLPWTPMGTTQCLHVASCLQPLYPPHYVDDVDGGNADSQLANMGSKLQKVYTAFSYRTIVIGSYYPSEQLSYVHV